MSSTQVRDLNDDTDLLLFASDDEFNFDDLFGVQLDKIPLTDAEISNILELPVVEGFIITEHQGDDSPASPTNVPPLDLEPKFDSSILESLLTVPPTVAEEPCVPAPTPEQPPASSNPTPAPTLFIATVIKPPALIEAKLFCRQEVSTDTGLLYLGHVTTPFLPRCFQTRSVFDAMLAQAVAHVRRLKPFCKVKPYYAITLTHPIFTYITNNGQPFSVTQRFIPAKRNQHMPEPMYTANENLIMTLTFTVDILPYGSPNAKQMFGPPPTDKPPIMSRLGTKRTQEEQQDQAKSATNNTPTETVPPKKKRHFFSNRTLRRNKPNQIETIDL